ncbi:PKD domain-containing protein [Hymenobacter sp. M29]|uniref:PKD domain-containing protein n=1 Tax=Hymenobacter mellowenesis TaxID=3063995 RepID=A0ABT9AED0_9BACT|nr:PKD domain-containing protein [Hymenobacter sp. M29]MDO7848186.1 PKD domain-containing protein [Hymenobacter sp. M29]
MKKTTLLAHGLALLGALAGPGRAAAQTLPGTPAPAAYQPYQRTDPNSRIGGDLQRLYRRWTGTEGQPKATPAALRAAFPELLLSADSRTVLVRITAQDVATLTEALAGRGFVVKSSHPERHFVDGYLPLAQLAPGKDGLAALADRGLLGVMPVQRGRTNRSDAAAAVARQVARTSSTANGPVIGQAAYLMQAERVRALGGYDGRGLRIGVISDSYDNLSTAADAIAAGDLPAEGVQVLQEFPGASYDEGQGMSELIHDLAPGARLAFSSGTFGDGDMADQIRRLADPAEGNCRIIVDDLYFSYEPVYQRSVIGQAIADVRAQGVAYFTSACNFGDDTYLNNAPAFVTQANGAARLNFNGTGTGAAALRQHVTVRDGQEYATRLWWSDPYYTTAGVQTDLDLYLLSSRGDTVATSTEANRTNQLPTEFAGFTNDTSQTHTTNFYLHLVRRAGTATPARLRLTYYGTVADEWMNNGYSTTGHAGSPEAITVGAAPFYDANQPEFFTSKSGGILLFNPNGTPLATPQVLLKPELAALDGTDTRAFDAPSLPRADRPANGYPNFFGTSASAPHAAAVAALLWQAQPTLTVAQLLARLQSTARDIVAAGFDDLTGAGVVDAYAAIYGTTARPAVPTAAQPWVDDMNRGGLSRAWVVTATGPARPWVRSEIGPASGRYHLVLDASAQGTGLRGVAMGQNTAAATLHANLSGTAPATGWYLTFRHKRIAGETNQQLPAQFSTAAYGDGVSLSADGGQTWYRLVDLTTLTNTTYQVQSTNLSAFAQANSLTLGSNVRLRFQQSGLTSADSTGGAARGGWAFDDVALTAGPAGVLPLFTSTATSATCPSLTVTYTDASLNAPAGAARQWSFPGGTPATSTAASPVVTYATAGTYNVSLTIGTGSSAVTLTDTAYVRLPGRAPVPVATASKTRVCPAEAVQFTASAVYCPGGYSWRFPGGTPARSTAANPTVSYATPGIYTVVLTATNAAGSDSVKTLRVQVKPTVAVPTAIQPFNTAPVPDYWEIVNPDNAISWISFPAIGPNGQPGSSVGVNGYDYSAVGQRDRLLSVPVALPASLPRATLRFAVAYAPYPGYTDSLLVRVLSRCAPHQVLGTVYRKGGAQLATAAPTPDYFFPAGAQEWRTEQVNLSAYRGQDVVLAFEFYNGNSNIVWIDDYRVDAQVITAATSAQATAAGLLAWPNPVAGRHALTVEAPASPAPATLRLLDALGREVWHGTAPAGAAPVRQPVVAPAASGVYLLQYVPATGQPLVQRVVVE